MDSGPDMNENMRMAEQYVREAAEQGAKLILFPETAEYTGADMPGHASAVPGYVSRRFSSLAKRYGVYLHCGSMTVRRHPGRPSNTSFLFGPDGETIAEYSKIHMFDVNIPGSVSYEESHEICSGGCHQPVLFRKADIVADAHAEQAKRRVRKNNFISRADLV